MGFRIWLESLQKQTWYHVTNREDADNILKKGWAVNVPRKTDAGDLGWGIYFWDRPSLQGVYGNVVLASEIQMEHVLDIHDENDPKTKYFHKLLFYDVKGDGTQKTRTIDPYANIASERGKFKDKAMEMLRKQGHDYGSALEKASNYLGQRDDTLRELNTKMIRRQMMRIGVKGVKSGKELVVYDPKIILSVQLFVTS